jgi:restriction system protein
MPIPGFQEFFRPLLAFAADGNVHTLAEARDAIARQFRFTEEELAELLPSGRQKRFSNRIAWTKVHLDAAGLLTSTARGQFAITDRGRDVLRRYPDRIDLSTLAPFEEYQQFRSRSKAEPTGSADAADVNQTETPEETIERGYQSIRSELASTLLTRVKESSPSFFEQLVVDLLLKMGYGRSRADAGQAIGMSGDEGIDGIISEDKLGLDTIYIQAKRWQGTVGRPEIQKFVGALHGKRARKGVFLTTGVFSKEASDYAGQIDVRVVLIDGEQLANYMIDYGLGVTTRSTFEIKRIDSDYFTES